MLKDNFYGQWLVLNVPFKKLKDFVKKSPEINEKVPRAIAISRALSTLPPKFGTTTMPLQL
eukprot:10019584-Karenia_brevis.AAC.1